MNQTALTDSCFWIGLTDASDPYHEKSLEIAQLIEENQTVIPWPCLYETVSTRLVRKRKQLILFEQLIQRPNVILMNDEQYRDAALEQVLFQNRMHGNSFSLVDGVIREILKDQNTRIHYLVTFNQRDFEDVCQQRQVPILG